jgi:hypothetical protein
VLVLVLVLGGVVGCGDARWVSWLRALASCTSQRKKLHCGTSSSAPDGLHLKTTAAM